MPQEKLYKTMSPEEQLQWLTDFNTFTKSKLPILAQLGDAWEAAHFKTFEEGLRLLNAFAYCRDFVKNSLFYHDFARRVPRMQWFVNKVKAEVSKGMAMQGIDGERVVYIPTSATSRRRGRPKKEEAAAAAAAAAENKAEEEKARVIATLVGATPMERAQEKEPSNEELLAEKRKADAATPSLFQGMETEENRTSAVDLLIAENRPHLDQIAFLLTPSTASEVAQIRGYRTSFAAAAERAKLLAEQGSEPETVAPYAQKAAALTKTIESIYLHVDTELARLYVLMPMDSTIDGHRDQLAERRLTDADLLTMLKPYADKMKQENPEFEAKVIAEFEASRPEVVAARKAEAARQAEVAALRKYIMRTDKKATKTRVKGIRERIARLKELGEDTQGMEVILKKTEEDAE